MRRSDGARRERAKVYNGKAHRTLRAQWAERLRVDGQVACHDPAPGCPGVIVAGQPFDLAHDHVDPAQYLGPAHPRCNRWHAQRLKTARERVARGFVPVRSVRGPLSS